MPAAPDTRLMPAPAPAPAPAPSDAGSAYETLIQFLYRAPIGLVETRLDGSVEMINPMAANLLLLAGPAALDNLFDALESVAPQLRRLASEFEPASGEVCESVRIVLPASATGSTGPLAAPGQAGSPQVLSISLLKLDENRLMATLADATADVQRERRGLETKLDAALRIDSLTRLPNRAAVRELIEQAMARRSTVLSQASSLLADSSWSSDSSSAATFAVLFMNCDRFRQINDALGHSAGDEVLGVMADRIRSTLRQRQRGGSDPAGAGPADNSPLGGPSTGQEATAQPPMAGRIGGDEFVVLVDDLRAEGDLATVAQRLLDVLGQPYGIRAGQQLHCSVSIGIVLEAQIGPATDADAVLQDASIAMVEAKRAGGARYAVFEPAMQERAARRNSVENDLRRAIAGQELFVVYQPVVGLAPAGPGRAPRIDRTAGVEALVRWRHQTRGIVPPLEFIGIAEECGLIGPLGEFVLATACRQFVAWQRQLGRAAPQRLAVNLSRGQLADPEFAATVAAILASTGMPAGRLQLEVTESLAAQDETVQARLHELKALGLTLALDDFGTGYSSLASLHLLPVDTVKIDRSFVSQAVQSLHHRVLIEATVRVAASLSMRTVAEGIETRDQAELVCDVGCEKGQGYLFSRPLEAADLVRWLGESDEPAEEGAVSEPAGLQATTA